MPYALDSAHGSAKYLAILFSFPLWIPVHLTLLIRLIPSSRIKRGSYLTGQFAAPPLFASAYTLYEYEPRTLVRGFLRWHTPEYISRKGNFSFTQRTDSYYID